jgi:hypothetical protein
LASIRILLARGGKLKLICFMFGPVAPTLKQTGLKTNGRCSFAAA